MKTETIATTRDSQFFNPKQHCSLHHLYFLLDDKIKIKNLVNVFSYANKKPLYGIVKKISSDSDLIRQSRGRSLKIGEDLFAIHYS